MDIVYLEHDDIDYDAWDKTISQSNNSLIYAYSWYLDIVSPEWEALILGNYEYIMPLTVKTRIGICYIAQPIICQQLGIFSKNDFSQEIIKKFIYAIPYFSYSIHLNYKNPLTNSYRILKNFTLNLNIGYKKIYSNYSKNTKKNIVKAEKSEIEINPNITLMDFLEAYYSENTDRFIKPPRKILEKLIRKAIEKKSAILYGGYLRGKLICTACFFKSSNRITYIKSFSNKEAKKYSGMYLLIDEVLKKYAGKDIIFDFDGSNVESVAYFYQGFGGVDEPYYEIRKYSIVSFLQKIKR